MSAVLKGNMVRQRRLPLLLGLFLVLACIALLVNLRLLPRRAANARIQEGITALSARRPQDAERAWLEAIKSDPSRPEPYSLLAELYQSDGFPEKALPLLEHLAKSAPDTKHLYSQLAECYALTNQADKALEAARKAVTQDPADPRAHALLGIQLSNRMDSRGAVSELSKAALLAPTDDKIALSLAQAQLDAGDFPGAERMARQVIAHDPNYVTAYSVLGLSFSERTPTPENLKQAIAAFQKLTELDPSRADGFAELGRMQELAGNNAAARTALQKAWQLGLRDATLAFNLSSVCRKLGDAKQAALMASEFKRLSDYHARSDALLKTLSVSPNNVDAALELAELNMSVGRYQEALPLMKSLVQARPEDARVLQDAQKLSNGLGDPQSASVYRERLRALKSSLKKEGK